MYYLILLFVSLSAVYADFGLASDCKPVRGLGALSDTVYRCNIQRNFTSNLLDASIRFKYKSLSSSFEDIADGVILQSYIPTQLTQKSEYVVMGQFAKGTEVQGMHWHVVGGCLPSNASYCNKLKDDLAPGSCFKMSSIIGSDDFICHAIEGTPSVDVYEFGSRVDKSLTHILTFYLNVLGRESLSTYNVLTGKSHGDVSVMDYLSDFVSPQFDGIVKKLNNYYGVESHHVNNDISSCSKLDVKCDDDDVQFNFDGEHQILPDDFQLEPIDNDYFNLVTDLNHTNHVLVSYIDYLVIVPPTLTELHLFTECLSGKSWLSGVNTGNPMKLVFSIVGESGDESLTLYADGKFNVSIKSSGIRSARYKDLIVHASSSCAKHARLPSIDSHGLQEINHLGNALASTAAPTSVPKSHVETKIIIEEITHWYDKKWVTVMWSLGSVLFAAVCVTTLVKRCKRKVGEKHEFTHW